MFIDFKRLFLRTPSSCQELAMLQAGWLCAALAQVRLWLSL